jgi:hypothetical protein
LLFNGTVTEKTLRGEFLVRDVCFWHRYGSFSSGTNENGVNVWVG